MKTKELLADSFRTLVLTVPFQKISIKMITDGAHVIRPTFYNYFQDKYEVIEFLFDRDIGSKVEVMIENDMEQEAIKLMFICFEKNKEYDLVVIFSCFDDKTYRIYQEVLRETETKLGKQKK